MALALSIALPAVAPPVRGGSLPPLWHGVKIAVRQLGFLTDVPGEWGRRRPLEVG